MGGGREQKNKQISFSILIFHKLDEISKASVIFFFFSFSPKLIQKLPLIRSVSSVSFRDVTINMGPGFQSNPFQARFCSSDKSSPGQELQTQD